MLSRKYYQQIASVLADSIAQARAVGDEETVEYITEQVVAILARMFKLDNPNFDPSRFYKACGVAEVRT